MEIIEVVNSLWILVANIRYAVQVDPGGSAWSPVGVVVAGG